MRAVDGLPGMYGVGLVCMMCNRQSRRFGDFVAGTVVVHEKPTEEVRPSWNTSAENPAATPGLGQVTADELVTDRNLLASTMGTGSPDPSAHGDSHCGEGQSKDGPAVSTASARRRFSRRGCA